MDRAFGHKLVTNPGDVQTWDYGKEITQRVRGSSEIRMEWIEYEKLGNFTYLIPENCTIPRSM